MAFRALILGLSLTAGGCLFQVDGLPLDGGALDLAHGEDAATLDLAPPADSASDDRTMPPTDLPSSLVDLPLLPDLSLLPDLIPPPPDLLVPFCGEPNLIACYRFEDGATATTATDGSGQGNHLTLTQDVETAAGHTGAALLGSTGGLAHVAHNSTLDVAQLTLELWVNPSSLPIGGNRAGLIDEDGQYGLFVYSPGILRCTAGGVVVSTMPNTITTGAWQHVACTFDQSVMRLYVDGAQLASVTMAGTIATNQPNGLCVASNSPSSDNLVGMVDEVRIFSVARTAGEIAADAQ